MANAPGTLETFALELGKALQPLEQLLGPEMFFKLGVELPREISGDATLLSNLTAAGTKAGELDAKITSLANAISSDDTAGIISSGVSLVTTIAALIAKLVDVGTALHTAANSLSPADKAKLQDFAGNMVVRTLEYVTVGYLDERMPTLTTTLALLGIIDKEFTPAPEIEISKTPLGIVPRRFYLDRFPKLLSHPDQYLQQVYKWGANNFDGSEMLLKILALMESLGLPAAIYQSPGKPPVLEAFVFSIQADDSVNPPGLKFELSLPGNKTFDKTIDFSNLWKGTVHVEANYAAGVDLTIKPPFDVNLKPPSGNLDLNVLLGLKADKGTNDPIVILGVTGGTRLEAKSISGSIGVDASLGTSGGAVTPELQFSIDEGKLVIDFSQGDGFIQKILSGIHLEADFSLIASWNPKTGLKLQGQAGVEIFIPLHIDLAVIIVNGIYFSIGFSGDTPLQIGLATQLTAQLGPLTAVVDHIGINIGLTFPSDGKGRLGMADVDFSFQPPKGVGLSVDAGVITGGGFLYLDVDKGEYYGALELTFEGIIALKAIGIINTKMPDGSNGFALLILITAEFTPIQLGFGFTLNGVGGLLGVNRTTDLDALKTGVRTDAIESILFPQNIVANITRIVSDLKSFFPIAEGHFLIGPMAKIGWGTPTLISLELGIIIDIPVPRLIILGILKCILPTEDAAILKLQVNFDGGIDFDQGMIWFDASLFDSYLLILTLTGDMALRIGWKTPMFILSVGGFHPAFHEIPPDLTNMKRLGISLLSGDNPRLSIMTYFAITSNSVQNGAKVELYAEACGLNVYGFLGYDLLVQFSPFHFIADIYAGLALRAGTDTIAGIDVHCELSGPTPWNANGDASLTILFFTISVGFNVTWGDTGPAQPVDTEDVLKLVVDAVSDDRNWKADLPANTNQSVTLKKLNLPDDKIVIHPFGILGVSQKIVPLDFTINKFGNKKPSPDTTFSMTYSGGPTQNNTEEFAIANFLQMSDSEKLSRKSFEQMKSGLVFQGGNSSVYGSYIDKDVDYELEYVHRKKPSLRMGIVKLFGGLFDVLVKGSAATKSAYSVSKTFANNAPAKVDTPTQQYMVVNTSDLSLHTAGAVASSQAEAFNLHDSYIQKDPSLKGNIQVVSAFELN